VWVAGRSRPQYPRKPFESLEDVRTWVATFVNWYNNVHQHSGINFVTPSDRHAGKDAAILANRVRVYELARQQNPNRWSANTRNWECTATVPLNAKHNQKAA